MILCVDYSKTGVSQILGFSDLRVGKVASIKDNNNKVDSSFLWKFVKSVMSAKMLFPKIKNIKLVYNSSGF